jgi:hypothetical protein
MSKIKINSDRFTDTRDLPEGITYTNGSLSRKCSATSGSTTIFRSGYSLCSQLK